MQRILHVCLRKPPMNILKHHNESLLNAHKIFKKIPFVSGKITLKYFVKNMTFLPRV